MATESNARKSSRIDLRMSDEQKGLIETAASLSGLSISQWSIGQLVSAAREQILTSTTLRLSAEAFEEFSRLLEEPADERFVSLLEEETTWEG